MIWYYYMIYNNYYMIWYILWYYYIKFYNVYFSLKEQFDSWTSIELRLLLDSASRMAQWSRGKKTPWKNRLDQLESHGNNYGITMENGGVHYYHWDKLVVINDG